MHILYVCTANICRSVSAQSLLLDAIADAPELGWVEVRSAGTKALVGAPGCSAAPALVGHADQHRARQLTADLSEWADLVLVAASEHGSAVVDMVPAARDRTFTMRAAERIADWLVVTGMVQAGRDRVRAGTAWSARYAPGDPRLGVQPLPGQRDQRGAWIVGEMHAARGLAGWPGEAAEVGGGGRRRLRLGMPGGLSVMGRGSRTARREQADRAAAPGHGGHVSVPEMSGDDVADPHEFGAGLHGQVHEQLVVSTAAMARLLREVARDD